ncbi:MAG: 30S ribosomal protein S6--L-glutamate ligase, partial [Chloroflexi bacterium]|nr:30S ribosomal protein S6--L-glutamate ligase [Chloroflexota bacterium]
MRIGVLCSRIRVEEKLIFAELDARGIEYVRLNDDELIFDLNAGH